MITIYTLTYNEEFLLEFFIKHYQKNFPNCSIIIYDNESTDNTVEIAKRNNCQVINYSTNNIIYDSKWLEMKNTCWKNSQTDWVLICDCDELLQMTQEDLINEITINTNIIKPTAFNMVGFDKDINLNNIKYGFRDSGYDKTVLFNSKQIKEINYSIGCHKSNPISNEGFKIKYNENEYKLLHYKYLSDDYYKERHKMYRERLSEENKQKNWSVHYLDNNLSESSLEKGKKNLHLLK